MSRSCPWAWFLHGFIMIRKRYCIFVVVYHFPVNVMVEMSQAQSYPLSLCIGILLYTENYYNAFNDT